MELFLHWANSKEAFAKDFCKWIESVLTIISLMIEADQSGTYRKIIKVFGKKMEVISDAKLQTRI
jgi:hypothetical protein